MYILCRKRKRLYESSNFELRHKSTLDPQAAQWHRFLSVDLLVFFSLFLIFFSSLLTYFYFVLWFCRFSHGSYLSIEHHTIVNSKKVSLSITTFYCQKLDGEISIVPSLIKPKTLALLKRITYTDYLRRSPACKLRSKSYANNFKIWNEDGKSYQHTCEF